MKRVSRTLFAVLTATALILGSCSKSVEGESRRWDTGTAQVRELALAYPGFRPALEARKAAAARLHDAAAGLEGDAKIAKLSEANTLLMKDFVGELDAIDDRIKKLRDSRVEVTAQASEATRLGARAAAEDAQQALERADELLKTGAADEASAAVVLEKLRGDLDAAQAALDKVRAIDRTKQDDAAKKAEVAKQADDDAAAAAKVTPWRCSYCRSENPHDETTCKSCGAPRADAEAKAPAR